MGESDNMYFMASDARLSTEYAVQNNTPENFETLTSSEIAPDESFSSRNVNPDYLSRYQSDTTQGDDEIVYFDETTGEQTEGNPDIDVYNNFYSGNGVNSNFNSASAFNMGFNMGLMSGFSPWGMGGFYDPFWGPGFSFRPGFGFRPGFHMSIGLGFGWGRPFMRPFGMGGFYDPFWGMGGFGMGGFYDPFWGPNYAWGGFPRYGFGNPIFVLPGNEFGDRRLVRGARPTRGAGLANANFNRGSAGVLPSTSRAQARRDAMGSNRSLVSSDRTRATARDFGSSQNDYYNSSRSRVATSATNRNVNSAALDRSSAVRTRSAMPTGRSSIGTPNTRTYSPNRSMNNYNNRRVVGSPSYNRSTSPSYNRTNPTRRVTTPTYNRSNTRTSFPSRSGSVGVPSRSSGGMSTGGSRGGGGVSTGSRGGRGN